MRKNLFARIEGLLNDLAILTKETQEQERMGALKRTDILAAAVLKQQQDRLNAILDKLRETVAGEKKTGNATTPTCGSTGGND